VGDTFIHSASLTFRDLDNDEVYSSADDSMLNLVCAQIEKNTKIIIYGVELLWQSVKGSLKGKVWSVEEKELRKGLDGWLRKGRGKEVGVKEKTSEEEGRK
jgi:hypothetical protein